MNFSDYSFYTQPFKTVPDPSFSSVYSQGSG